MPNKRHFPSSAHQLISSTNSTWEERQSITSDNGSICLLVQFLAGPDVEPLTGLHCILFKISPLEPSIPEELGQARPQKIPPGLS